MYYTPELVEVHFSFILSEIEKGRALRTILAEEINPTSTTFYKWLNKSPEMAARYARACSIRTDALVEEMLYIADNPVEGTQTTVKGDGSVEVKTGDMTHHRKLQIDTRKWIAAKLQPKKYGEKLEVENTEKAKIEYMNVSKQFPDEDKDEESLL